MPAETNLGHSLEQRPRQTLFMRQRHLRNEERASGHDEVRAHNTCDHGGKLVRPVCDVRVVDSEEEGGETG